MERGKNNNYVNLFKSKNNGIGHTTNYDKRNQIVYPNWMLNRKFTTRIVRRLWVAISGGYHHTYKIYERKQLADTLFFFGSQWWWIHRYFCKYIFDYMEKHPEYEQFFAKSRCPDESFFHTLLMNSPYADMRRDYLHYIDWSEGKSSPKTLTYQDFDAIINSKKLFARKIDNDIRLINLPIEHIDG